MNARRGPLLAGLVLIVVGALLLARELVPAFDIGVILPVASVLLGIALMVLSVRPTRPSA
jgi:uncharacterized membrane protein HdeD (DUF308 family)